MNARSENAAAYAGGEFFLYLDDEIFYAASQYDSGFPYPDKDFKADLEVVGQLCRILHKHTSERNQSMHKSSLLPLQRRFEVISQTYPGAHAVRCNGSVLTYGELDAQADALALHLQQQGLLPGSFCLLKLAPSLAQVRVILAVLKAGAAYLQFDPKLPPQHAAAVMDVLKPAMLFVHSDDPVHIDVRGMQLIRCAEEAEDLPYGWPDEADIGPGTPAYAFASMSSRGGVCMSLRTHHVLAAARHTVRNDRPLPSADPDPLNFWRVLSEGTLLTIPSHT
jgi:non-ribosomal peptide synthetase component F